MNHLHSLLRHGVAAFDLVVLSYFFLGNGIYTSYALSLRATWVHMRQMAYQGLDSLRRSPLTPPVTIIIPAWNEQGVIVNTVRSALQTDYPNFQVIVVDDGSTDIHSTAWCSIIILVEMERAYHPSIPTAPVRAFTPIPDSPTCWSSAKCAGASRTPSTPASTFAASPYFCNLDADCLLERDALLRLDGSDRQFRG